MSNKQIVVTEAEEKTESNSKTLIIGVIALNAIFFLLLAGLHTLELSSSEDKIKPYKEQAAAYKKDIVAYREQAEKYKKLSDAAVEDRIANAEERGRLHIMSKMSTLERKVALSEQRVALNNESNNTQNTKLEELRKKHKEELDARREEHKEELNARLEDYKMEKDRLVGIIKAQVESLAREKGRVALLPARGDDAVWDDVDGEIENLKREEASLRKKLKEAEKQLLVASKSASLVADRNIALRREIDALKKKFVSVGAKGASGTSTDSEYIKILTKRIDSLTRALKMSGGSEHHTNTLSSPGLWEDPSTGIKYSTQGDITVGMHAEVSFRHVSESVRGYVSAIGKSTLRIGGRLILLSDLSYTDQYRLIQR